MCRCNAGQHAFAAQMLYDNGQLAQTYLDAYRITGNERYARVARGILDYLRRDMTHPDGGFYSAEVHLFPCSSPLQAPGSQLSWPGVL